MMISPDVTREREITVLDYKPKIPSPVIFNVNFRDKMSFTQEGLTFREAKTLHKLLGLKIKAMCKNPKKRNINQYK